MATSPDSLFRVARRQAAFLEACLFVTILAYAAAPAAYGIEERIGVHESVLRDAGPIRRDGRDDDFIEHAGLAGSVREARRVQIFEPLLPRACSGDWQFSFSFGGESIAVRAADAPLHPFGIERHHASRAPPFPNFS